MDDKWDKLMKILKEGLPEYSSDYIPDIVHDFLRVYWKEITIILLGGGLEWKR